MLNAPSSDLAPPQYLAAVGDVFACFDRQDSGNISFGVAAGGRDYFVKTAGDPATRRTFPLTHDQRVAVLANAERLARSVQHPALTRFVRSMPSPWGRVLIYEWASGEHLHEPRERRHLPATARQRFLRLRLEERLAVVATLIDLHVALAAEGWVVGDFYDGCLIYDFDRKRIHVFDLDHYQQGPYENTVGRMFGSTRFMAPEEFKKGCVIDERTTVFALGRTMSIFLGDATAPVAEVACARDPAMRHATVAALAAHFAATVRA